MVKNPPASLCLISGWGRSPGEGNDNPLQYSCLGNFMNRGARQATVHGVTKQSDMTEQINTNNFGVSDWGECIKLDSDVSQNCCAY